MLRSTKNNTRKRFRPKAGIDPIHVHELLAAAGMSGFLGVLEPPVPLPHLQKLARGVSGVPPGREAIDHRASGTVAGAAAAPEESPAAGLLPEGQKLVEAFLKRLGSQDEALRGVSEVVRRMNGSAERLRSQAERIFSRQAGA